MTTTRTALVTGASRGIGLGIAQRLASRGFGLTISARDSQALDVVAADLAGLGAARVEVCAGDLADATHCQDVLDVHRAAFGSMNLLVLNAGVGTAGAVDSYPMSRFDKTVAVNLRSPFLLLQGGLEMLRAAASEDGDRGARIVVMSSITAVFAEPGLAAYGATKAALLALVDGLNVEESGNGVSATALAPAFVDTDMSAWATDRIPAEEMIPVADVVRLVEVLVDLSHRSVIPRILMTRAGTSGFVA
jgi:3-oxoacyl-[acyl-carrier protein] reductase